MTATATYMAGAELDDLPVTWYAEDGTTVYDYSSGWTFELKVGQVGSSALFVKTAGISGAATAPNLVVAWATTGELNGLSPGGYNLQIRARRTADSKDRFLDAKLVILPAIL